MTDQGSGRLLSRDSDSAVERGNECVASSSPPENVRELADDAPKAEGVGVRATWWRWSCPPTSSPPLRGGTSRAPGMAP